MRNRLWTDDADQHLRDHWHNPAMTLRQIGAGIGRTANAVKNRGYAILGLPTRPDINQWPDDVLEEIKALYRAGTGPKEIAAQVGMGVSKVRAKLDRIGALRRRDTTPRPVAQKAPPRPKLPKPPKPILRVVGATIVEEAAPRPPRAYARKAEAFAPLDGSNPKVWTEREFGECNWPVGGSGGATLSCCLPAAGAWCPTHLAMGTVPAPQRKPRARTA
jgi:hypothetical protein